MSSSVSHMTGVAQVQSPHRYSLRTGTVYAGTVVSGKTFCGDCTCAGTVPVRGLYLKAVPLRGGAEMLRALTRSRRLRGHVGPSAPPSLDELPQGKFGTGAEATVSAPRRQRQGGGALGNAAPDTIGPGRPAARRIPGGAGAGERLRGRGTETGRPRRRAENQAHAKSSRPDLASLANGAQGPGQVPCGRPRPAQAQDRRLRAPHPGRRDPKALAQVPCGRPGPAQAQDRAGALPIPAEEIPRV